MSCKASHYTQTKVLVKNTFITLENGNSLSTLQSRPFRTESSDPILIGARSSRLPPEDVLYKAPPALPFTGPGESRDSSGINYQDSDHNSPSSEFPAYEDASNYFMSSTRALNSEEQHATTRYNTDIVEDADDFSFCVDEQLTSATSSATPIGTPQVQEAATMLGRSYSGYSNSHSGPMNGTLEGDITISEQNCLPNSITDSLLNVDYPQINGNTQRQHEGVINEYSRRQERTEGENTFQVNTKSSLDNLPILNDGYTTVMLRNIPNKYTQSMLLDVLNEEFCALFDFFYLPIDFKNRCNVGYAFINFVHSYYADKFMEKFTNKRLTAFKSSKVCSVAWGRVQGLAANIEQYRNSAVMSVSSSSYKPMLFRNGTVIPWPSADRPLPIIKPRSQKVNSNPYLSMAG